MAHVAKYTNGSTGALTRHYERAKSQITGEYIKFGNQEIDLGRTHENYNLAPDRNQLEFIKQRCSEVHCLNRKDVNVMCSWVLTTPKDLPKTDEQKFFEKSYEFLKDRYGGEKNVISAYVHKDETSPHMHFSFVPITYDSKKDRDTVSAKTVLNRGDLQSFHSDLEKHLAKSFGREIGILNEATREGNLSIEELKRQSAIERLQKANKQAEQIIDTAKMNVAENLTKMQNDIKIKEQEASNMLEKAQQEAQKTISHIETLQEEAKRLQGQIEGYTKVLATNSEIDNMGKEVKGLFKEKSITFTVDESNQLKDMAKAFWSEKNKAERFERESIYKDSYVKAVPKLQKEVRELEKKVKIRDDKLNKMISIIKGSPNLRQAYNEAVIKMQEKIKLENASQKLIQKDNGLKL